MPRNYERMTVSLPPTVAAKLRRIALTAHAGNVSAATAEAVTKYPEKSSN